VVSQEEWIRSKFNIKEYYSFKQKTTDVNPWMKFVSPQANLAEGEQEEKLRPKRSGVRRGSFKGFPLINNMLLYRQDSPECCHDK